MQLTRELLQTVTEIAVRAGAEIMDVYRSTDDLQIQTKGDDSPLTVADLRAHRVIVEGLQQLRPEIPVLSEESEMASFSERSQWQEYWLVDPLDGTKEFIGRNGEFTVNIALIRRGEPVLGVVHVPAQETTYSGVNGDQPQAWLSSTEGQRNIRINSMPSKDQWPSLSLRVVASRRHGGEQLEGLLQKLRTEAGNIELVNMGSSLKICLVAEGRADIYPRLAPTSEWDTAAAHAVLRGAGGDIVNTDFSPLRYNQKDSILNPHFIALGDLQAPWQALIS